MKFALPEGLLLVGSHHVDQQVLHPIHQAPSEPLPSRPHQRYRLGAARRQSGQARSGHLRQTSRTQYTSPIYPGCAATGNHVKAVDLAINALLPQELRDYKRSYTKKNIDSLLSEVALQHPKEYARIVKGIADIGRHASYHQGETLTLNDMRPVIDRDGELAKMDHEVAISNATAKSPADAHQRKLEIWGNYATSMEKATVDAALAQRNNLGNTVVSGARGSPLQMKSMITTPGLFVDYKDRVIPMFVRRSYGEGLRPAEYLASSFGVRKNILSTKNCLSEETLVRMADWSEKRIRDIVPGDWVLGADKIGATFPVKVLRLIDQGQQDVKDYEFTIGRSYTKVGLRATAQHKLLVVCTRSIGGLNYARLKAENGGASMKPEGYIPVVLPLSTKHKRFYAIPQGEFQDKELGLKHEPLALLLGLITGDGCHTTSLNGHIQFTCADPSLVDIISKPLALLGLKLSPHKSNAIQYYVVNYDYKPFMNGGIQKGNQGFVKGKYGNRVRAYLSEHSMYGKYSYEKDVPPEVWTWSNTSVAAYLAGLFATDGSVYKGANGVPLIDFSSTSEKLINNVSKLLAWRFGIHTAQPEKTVKGGFHSSQEIRKRPIYTLTVAAHRDVAKLAELINMPGKKGARLKEILFGYKLKNRNDQARWRRISERPCGLMPCFDIEVDHPDHLFVLANGLIVSNSTAEAGDLLKQMNASTANIVVTSDDCGTTNGLDYDAEDPEIEGRVAAKDYGDVKAGTVLDRKAIAHLHRKGVKKIMIRSPMTCQAKDGICAHCLGTLHDGKFAPKGYMAGVTSSAALGEPMTQGALSSKSSGGGAFKGAKRQFSGMPVIESLMQSPETFPHRAAVSEQAGRVESIEDASQGGKYITVAGQQHYALPGYESLVKPGDQVEAGDQLSEGIMDPADIVRLRGLGDGRRYYVDRMRQAIEESGLPKPSRLNLEVLARGTLDHVRVDNNEGIGDLLPDDVGSYNTLSSSYQPAKDTKMVPIAHAHGHYLQVPSLHFSIGTKLTPKMTHRLHEAGVGHVAVSDTPPDFVPEMQRLRSTTHSNSDWFSRLHSSYLSTTLGEAGERSRDADFNSNTHFAGPLAKGDQFGKKIMTTGKF